MKTVFLTVLLALVLASGAFAVTTARCDIQLYQMSNQIACPLVPLDPSPIHDGPGLYGLVGVFGEWYDLYIGSDWVKKLEPTNGSEKILLQEWGPDEGCLVGEGYMGWVDAAEPYPDPVKTFGFDGVDISDTDIWVSLPGITGGAGGTHWVGVNYPVDPSKYVNYLQIVITDGTDAYTMEEVLGGAAADWIDPFFIYYDAASQGEKPLIAEWAPEMYGGQMYRITTMKSNLALILPKPVSY